MNILNVYLSNITELNLYFIVLLIILLISLVLVISERKFVQFIGIIVILTLTFISKSQWCYLAIVIYIALKLKLIDDNLLEGLNNLRQAWFAKYKNEQRNNNDRSIVNNDIIKETDMTTSKEQSEKVNAKEIIKTYKHSERDVINWFALNKNLIFESDRKIFTNAKNVIYPDGIYETDTDIFILEVKHCFKSSNALSLFKRGVEDLKRNNNFFGKSDKSLHSYLAIVLDNDNFNNSSEIYTFIKDNDIFENINIFIFEQNDSGIKFIKNY